MVMPKNTIMLVHGMGKPTDEMFNQWQAALKRTYERYSEGELFEDRFDCFNIEYDSIFENLRSNWNEQIEGILNSDVTGLALPTEDDLSAFTEDNFYTTHIQDVLLYRFIPQVGENVRAHIIEKINEVVQSVHSSSEISVIAHSLGTSVIHDAVNVMYHQPDAHGNKLSPLDFRFQTIAMIANVSRTLKSRWSPYGSLVRPGVGTSTNYVTNTFFSTSHKWDPLVSLRRYSPVDNWPDLETALNNRVAVVEPSIITRPNIHDFLHYLENPQVNIPLFRMLRNKRFISKDEQNAAEKTYLAANPINEFHDYRKELKTMLTGEADFSWKRLTEVFKGFERLVKDFTD
jgi:hypothetical protein